MRPIELNLPAGSTVVGELLADYSHSRRRLMQDILQIHLPTGQSIDVGWYPDFDINGSFHIVVFEGEWDNQIEDPILVKAPSSVAWQIQELAQLRQFAN